ncbi:dephospho-CoA kinase [Olivibacter domesticus]|uniref:Dephospho-CoA kinase n=1 Tax=Olivibacter domesticus TaxID=407022 RepID=A0A1H7LKT9_OLID1|nr:dephospho-CoA kinase [Olivibacter domesticus]SEK99554.1 dephospho-CoA kinase [Olivibacter domesticus]
MKKFHIGVTGGIGSGKTVVCRIFETLGYPVFYADDEAKKVMTEDAGLVKGIKQHFGENAYFNDGSLNRKLLSDIVFHDADKLNVLNSLVHPATIKAYQNWAEKQQTALIFKEAALLFESNSYKLSDFNILVTAPASIRMQRVIKRDNVTGDIVKARMDKQMTDEEKEKLTDFIIVNDDKHALIPQVLRLNDHFLSLIAS